MTSAMRREKRAMRYMHLIFYRIPAPLILPCMLSVCGRPKSDLQPEILVEKLKIIIASHPPIIPTPKSCKGPARTSIL